MHDAARKRYIYIKMPWSKIIIFGIDAKRENRRENLRAMITSPESSSGIDVRVKGHFWIREPQLLVRFWLQSDVGSGTDKRNVLLSNWHCKETANSWEYLMSTVCHNMKIFIVQIPVLRFHQEFKLILVAPLFKWSHLSLACSKFIRNGREKRPVWSREKKIWIHIY